MINTNLNSLDDVFLERSFPIEECSIPDKKYLQLFNGINEYCCLIIDKRFLTERAIKIMKPYIWVENDEITCAWIDSNGNWIDNFENPVHGYGYNDEFVIGWIPYDKDNDDDYLSELVKKLSE